jgi:hypothetical protein
MLGISYADVLLRSKLPCSSFCIDLHARSASEIRGWNNPCHHHFPERELSINGLTYYVFIRAPMGGARTLTRFNAM